MISLQALSMRGQAEAWTAPVFPTTESLWGACSGPQGFVAVGEKGVILTSTDGMAWVNRVSGTNRWLLAVTWAQGAYYAVGDGGTLLVSTDSQTWRPSTTGTGHRLNAVLYADGLWMIAGEAGTVLTSIDGLAWTIKNVGESVWLRGLAYGQGRFVLCGQAGRIYVTADRGQTFTRSYVASSGGLESVAFDGEQFQVVGESSFIAASNDTWFWRRDTSASGSPSNTFRSVTSFVGTRLILGDTQSSGSLAPPPGGPSWRGIAANDRRAVAVGTNGAIATLLARSHRVSVSASFPDGQFVTAPAILRTSAYFGPGTQYQWLHDGVPIPGATTQEFVIPALGLAHRGWYSIAISRTDGGPTPSRGGIELPALPAHIPTLNTVDPAFQVPFTFVPELIQPLDDGRIYIADRDAFFAVDGRVQHGFMRLRPDGSLDPSFNLGSGLDVGGSIQQILPLPSGGVAISGTFTSVNGIPAPALAQFDAEGRLDTRFQPDAELRSTSHLRIPLRDGRWLALAKVATGTPAKAVRFNGQGQREFEYSFAMPLFLFPDWPLEFRRDSEGKIYVIGKHSSGGFAIRLQPDGTPDPDFLISGFEIKSMALWDNGIVVSTETFMPSSVFWRSEGALSKVDSRTGRVTDPLFEEIHWIYGYRFGVFIGPAPVPGTTLFPVRPVVADRQGEFIAFTQGYDARMGFFRLNSRGERDPEYSLESVANSAQITALPDGKLLAYGASTFNGRPIPGMVRLVPDRAAGRVGLSNLSVRARAGSGAQTLIVGYITANGSTSVLARGAGPALVNFGVPDALTDPQLFFFRESALVSQNNDWSTGSDASDLASTAARVGAFAFSPGSRDAALLATAPAGAYTLQVTSANPDSGVALAELYLTSEPPVSMQSPRIINFSVRTQVGTGAESLLAGFTVSGPNTRKLLIRAIGPSLSQFGVAGTLSDPRLTLYRGDLPIDENDQWGSFLTPYGGIYEATRVSGAFALDPNSKDAALIANLPPGGYTVQVTGTGGTTGVALLEVYELP